MSTQRQPGGLGQVLSIVALSLSAVAVALSVVALVLASVSLESDEDGELRLTDRYEFTVDFVQDALDRYDEEGREATVDYYNDPSNALGDYYIFIFDEEARLVSHINPDLLGRDLRGSLGLDSHGYRFGDVMLGATEEGLWVDYVFQNPTTGNQEFKHSWVVEHDGLLFGSG